MSKTRYERMRPLIERALSGEKCTDEQTEEQADGVRYWHNDYLPEMENEGSAGLYVLSYDVSSIHRSHEQIRQLAQRLESVREEERRSVATILHDGIAQDLFALKLEIDCQSPPVQREHGMARFCQTLGAAVVKCMEDIRQLANELRPIALSSVGVVNVVTDHARQFAQRAGLLVKVTGSTEFPRLDESIQLLLFRAAQEALTNVARHAKATHVEINFQATSEQVSMEVADDGIGITDADLHKSKSLGLLALKERIAAIGWQLAVARNEPHGTRLILTSSRI
jgi:signal transduction histidine kinase